MAALAVSHFAHGHLRLLQVIEDPRTVQCEVEGDPAQHTKCTAIMVGWGAVFLVGLGQAPAP